MCSSLYSKGCIEAHIAQRGNLLSQGSQCGDIAFRRKAILGGLQPLSFVPVQFYSCGCWLSFGFQVSVQCGPTGSHCRATSSLKAKQLTLAFGNCGMQLHPKQIYW